jgi:hypothetical protein
MFGSARWMWLRVAVWGVIIVTVTFMMRRPEVGDEVGRAALEAMGMGPAPSWTELVRPAGAAASPAPDGDPSVVLSVIQGLDRACVPAGTALRVSVGPGGLVKAEVHGAVPPCAGQAVWAAPWPALAVPFEVEVTRS